MWAALEPRQVIGQGAHRRSELERHGGRAVFDLVVAIRADKDAPIELVAQRVEMKRQRLPMAGIAAKSTGTALVLDHPPFQLAASLRGGSTAAARVAFGAGSSLCRRKTLAAVVTDRGSCWVIYAPSASAGVGLDLEVAVRTDQDALVQLQAQGLPAAVVARSDVEPLARRIEMVEVHRAQALAVAAKHARPATLVVHHPLLQRPAIAPAVRATRVALPGAVALVPVVDIPPAAGLAHALLTEHVFDGSWRSGQRGFGVC